MPRGLTPVLVFATVALFVIAPSAAARPETVSKFACDPTLPSGIGPVGEKRSPNHHANFYRSMWTVLPANGRVVIDPEGVKFPWWARRHGTLSIRGRSMDRRATTIRARVNAGQPKTAFTGAFWSSALFFPRAGCWAVTGTVGRSHLTFVVRVVTSR
jgi:hypothetical protein